MKVIQNEDLHQLSLDARLADRLRSHYNIHPTESDAIQRLCLAMEPGTYVRPHRHPEAGKWELFIVIQGVADVLLFDVGGQLIDRIPIADDATRIIEIPEQTWHSVIAKQSGTILFEVKPGPYLPLEDKNFADWAPPENAPQVAEFLNWFNSAEIGDMPPSRLEA